MGMTALTGALIGGVSSAITGGNVLQGAALGGIGGGLGGAVFGAGGGLAEGALLSATEYGVLSDLAGGGAIGSAFADSAANTFAASMAGGAAGGSLGSSWGSSEGGSFGGDFEGTSFANETGVPMGADGFPVMNSLQTGGNAFSQLGDFARGLTAPLNKSGGPFADLASIYKSASPYLSMASGVNSLLSAEEMRKRAQQLGRNADPFGASGARGLADSQYQALLRDPSAAQTGDPAFQARMQAAQRQTAAYGPGSGMAAVQAANASTDWYNNRLAQLGAGAGASFNPASAGQVELAGLGQAQTAQSQALGQIGFGFDRMGGSPGVTATMPPQVLTQLRAAGYIQ